MPFFRVLNYAPDVRHDDVRLYPVLQLILDGGGVGGDGSLHIALRYIRIQSLSDTLTQDSIPNYRLIYQFFGILCPSASCSWTFVIEKSLVEWILTIG